jgi:hypothetical protein
MTTQMKQVEERRKATLIEDRAKVKNLALLRLLAKGFIWLGAVACGAHLLVAVPSVSSFTNLLLIAIDTIGRLSATVGLGGVLLALAEIADGIGSRTSDQ